MEQIPDIADIYHGRHVSVHRAVFSRVGGRDKIGIKYKFTV